MDSVVHFEIPASNLARAKKFYSKVFGWDTLDINVGEMNYTMVHTAKSDKNGIVKEKGAINGGMMRKNGKIKSPVVTIAVKNMDKSIELARKNGGKLLVGKMPVGDMGFTSYIKDSEGNIMGLWQSK